jgi:hypothetical protein
MRVAVVTKGAHTHTHTQHKHTNLRANVAVGPSCHLAVLRHAHGIQAVIAAEGEAHTNTRTHTTQGALAGDKPRTSSSDTGKKTKTTKQQLRNSSVTYSAREE